MTRSLILFVDDGSPGFWTQPGWPVEWGSHEGKSFTPVFIDSFNNVDHPEDRIRTEIQIGVGDQWRQTYQDIYVVTDSSFRANNDLAGGSSLLERLSNSADLRWELAVVYSEQPRLDHLSIEKQDRVRVVEADPNETAINAEMIRMFFDTGIFPTLQPIWNLISELKILLLCAKTAVINPEISLAHLSQLNAYGVAASSDIDNRHPFDPALVGWQQRPPSIFSYETARYFVPAIQRVFESYLKDAAELEFIPKELARDGKQEVWERLCRLLHPIESLEQDSHIRQLWELTQTSSVSALIDEHPMLKEPALSARERCWVRTQLRKLISDGVSLAELVKKANADHEWLVQINYAIERASEERKTF